MLFYPPLDQENASLALVRTQTRISSIKDARTAGRKQTGNLKDKSVLLNIVVRSISIFFI